MGSFFGLKYVVPVMKKQGYGSIVNTASGAGLIGSPGFVGYNSSKHAVIGMTRVVALEAAPMGRYGEPEEVANVALFLLSDDASYVSQSIYTVDGGQMNQ